MAQGTTTIDFGAFPGNATASVDISAPGISGGSLADAWIIAVPTVDHSIGEHVVDPPDVYVGNIQAGVGFTIYGNYRSSQNSSSKQVCYGQWTVAWVYN